MKKHFLQCTIAVLLLIPFSCHHENITPSNGSQTSNANAIIYSGQLSGIYERGIALDTTNYIMLYLNVQAAGPYTITTATQNGYKFTATGKFTTTGSAQLKLQAVGTPVNEEMDSIKISTSLSHYNKIGIQVASNLSNKIIIASGGDDFKSVWSTVAITGRGKLLWKIPGNASFATINNGIVYYSDNHSLKAVKIATGDSLWSNPALQGMYNVTFSNQVLYVTGGFNSGGAYSAHQAVDATTGKVIWSYNPNQPGYVSMGAPVVGSNLVIFQQAGMYALDKATGSLVWSNTTTNVEGTPVLSGNVLYITGGYAQGTSAIDIATGKVIWTNTVDTYESPVLDNGKLYANGSTNVYCFDASTGKTLWTSATISDLAKSPAVSSGKVFVTTDFGFTSVYALDANTGSKLWTNGSSFGFPESELIAHEGMLYLGTGGSIDGYYLNNGKLVTYTMWGTAMQMDYPSLMAVYDTDNKQTSYPAHNAE